MYCLSCAKLVDYLRVYACHVFHDWNFLYYYELCTENLHCCDGFPMLQLWFLACERGCLSRCEKQNLRHKWKYRTDGNLTTLNKHSFQEESSSFVRNKIITFHMPRSTKNILKKHNRHVLRELAIIISSGDLVCRTTTGLTCTNYLRICLLVLFIFVYFYFFSFLIIRTRGVISNTRPVT